jgi:hypothetical protein
MTASRKEIARAFELAAQRIRFGDNDLFICWALEQQRTDAAEAARRVIFERLAPYDAYGRWLEVHHPEARQAYYDSPTAFREARLCWLAALIAEFSA